MDLPLELAGLRLSAVRDRPDTELRVDVSHVDGLAWLDVVGAQQLAGALMQWLADNGHALPDLPATEADLELMDHPATFANPGPKPRRVDVPATYATPDPDSRPRELPHQFGSLAVTRELDRVRIDRADEWIVATTALLERLRQPGGMATVDGLDVTLTDTDGQTVAYRMRPEIPAPNGMGVVLQRTRPLGPLPEHTR